MLNKKLEVFAILMCIAIVFFLGIASAIPGGNGTGVCPRHTIENAKCLECHKEHPHGLEIGCHECHSMHSEDPSCTTCHDDLLEFHHVDLQGGCYICHDIGNARMCWAGPENMTKQARVMGGR